MATNVHTASYQIAQQKRFGFLPNGSGSGGALTTTDLCALMNAELQLYLTALIKSVREDHLEVSEDIAVVAGTASYRINTRAVANSITIILDATASTASPVPLTQTFASAAWRAGLTGTPSCFELLGPSIVLHPTPTAAGTLRVRYLQRLSRVVAEDAVGLISATAATTVTVSGTIPSAFVTGAVFDFVRGNPPFDNQAIDQTGTVSGNTITFSSVPSTVAVGDYLALAGETPIPQVSPELHPLLSKRVALVVAQAMSSPSAAALATEVETLKAAALVLMTPRVSHGPRPLINFNGPGWRRWSK